MNEKKKKILVLANGSGGLYSFRKELLTELIKSNVVYAGMPLTIKIDELKKIGVELIDIPIDRRSVNPFRDFLLLARYIKIIKFIKPNQIITYTIKPNIYGGIAARLCHVNYAANITGLGTAFYNKGILRTVVFQLYKHALRKANTVFFENSENRGLFIDSKIIKEEQSCLLNGAGVNLEQFRYFPYPCENNPFSFLFVGRVMKEKGINELFEAMVKLRKDGFECVLNVLGVLEEDYSELIEKYSAEGWLIYHGHQDNVIPFIQATNCFVLPSWHEGMANTNLECASIGRPIITSNIPGCREAVIDKKSGFLCKPKDSDSLYNKMKNIMSLSLNQLEKMGIEGRKHMEEVFDKKAVVKNTIERLYL